MATYYGVNGTSDSPRGVAVDGTGKVVLVGMTNDATGDLASTGSYQTSNAGTYDAFVVKFDPTLTGAAQRLWGLITEALMMSTASGLFLMRMAMYI